MLLAPEPWTWSDRICFLFQAEDGIRDLTVTGVQTCALPISKNSPSSHSTIQETTSGRLRRRRPSTTVGEICSSKRSLSILALGCSSGDEFGGLRQHAL